MRHYETIYIINPDLSAEDNQMVIEKFNNLVEQQTGVIIKVEEWGKQKLAYEIKKEERGFYILLDYCGDPGLTASLERDLKLDDRILKYQTIKLADKVDPQELVQKKEEAVKVSEIKEDPTPEKEAEIQTQEKASSNEVKNGV